MKSGILTIIFSTVLVLFLSVPKESQAACTRCCNCETIRGYIVTEIERHETWLRDVFWEDYLEPELSEMTNRINAALVNQTTQLGTFVEAQNNIEKRRTLQELTAQSASNYAPSEQLCRFGSLSQSLAASEAIGAANQMVLLERSQGRQLGAVGQASTAGGTPDMIARMKQYVGKYCDANDNNAQLRNLCQTGSDKYLNADIDYVRTFDSRPTLNIDFTADRPPTDEERNILALSDNLFSHDLFSRITAGETKGVSAVQDARFTLLDMRSLIAKRSVAEHSFTTLVGQKAQGAPGAKSFIAGILAELGIEENAIMKFLGGNPSYDAQMEVLTKKIYQSPNFYVNLMDNPANVQRQYAAMQSFGLMQQRDIFESILRSEMLLSLIVELEVAKYQDEAQALMDTRKR